MSYIVVTDTTGIQSYIFNSNKLPEIIGASYLVDLVTSKWAPEFFGENELIYAGGGNCVAEFPNKEKAQKFIADLSKKAYEEAPGVGLIFGVCQDETKPLHERVSNAFKDIRAKKNARAISNPLLGLSVTRSCYATGLPASAKDEKDPKRYINASIKAKKNITETANKELKSKLLANEPNYNFPKDLDDLGRTEGDTSLIAIVHIDGNGIGKRIEEFGKNLSDNEGYKTKIKNFSKKLKEINNTALQRTIEDLKKSIKQENNVHIIKSISDNVAPIALKEDKKEKELNLPFRPIIVGGDDITFVCDGRLGISLAIRFMEHLNKRSVENPLPDNQGPVTASAGVAIVKSHYPFARAYQLAEELCSSAKQYRHQVKDTSSNFLDWHIAHTGISKSLADIRKQDYLLKEGDDHERKYALTQRPVQILQKENESSDKKRSWNIIYAAIDGFQKGYTNKRNKVKELREVLRQGENHVKSFVARHDKLPDLVINQVEDYRETGFIEKQCMYYDAIELLDLWIPLETQLED